MTPPAIASQILASLSSAVWLVDRTGEPLFANGRCAEFADDPTSWAGLEAMLCGVRLGDYLQLVVERGVVVEEPAVLLAGRRAGNQLVELRMEPGPEPGWVLVLVREVTSRTRAERQGALAETARALGHQVSNPLAILRGELGLLKRSGAPVTDERYARMERAIARIDEVLVRLRRATEVLPTNYLPSQGVRMFDLGGESHG